MASNTVPSVETPINRLKRKMETFPSVLKLRAEYVTKLEESEEAKLAEEIKRNELEALDGTIDGMREEVTSKEHKHFSQYSEWMEEGYGYSVEVGERDSDVVKVQLDRAKMAARIMEEWLDILAMDMVVKELERERTENLKKLDEAKGTTAEVEREVIKAGKSLMEGNIEWCEKGLKELEEAEEEMEEGAVKKRKLSDGQFNSV